VEQVALNRHVTPPKRLQTIKQELESKVKSKNKKKSGRLPKAG